MDTNRINTTTFKFVPYYGAEKVLNNVPKKPGNFLMTKEGKIYFDINDHERVLVATRDNTYIHSQRALSDVWTIKHNLGKFPSVSVVDSIGSKVEGDVTYIDNDTIRIKFSIPFTGKAFCN